MTAMGGTGPHAAPLLGDIGRTTVSGADQRTGRSFAVGEDIFGPFENGFGAEQSFIMERLGCTTPSDGFVAGGIDTHTAEQMMSYQCTITLPRIVDDGSSGYLSLLDECGGHTREYHFHESMKCLYDGSSGAHSTKIGEGNKGGPLYGKWEHTERGELPLLDACGGHFGRTPDSPQEEVYHYHVQDGPPFTFGCYGPDDDGSLVTVEQCRKFYPGCDDKLVTVRTNGGEIQYDDWCPCFDAKGSNTGVDIVPLPVFSATGITKNLAQKSALGSPAIRRRTSPSLWPLAVAAALMATAAVALTATRRGGAVDPESALEEQSGSDGHCETLSDSDSSARVP